MKCPLCNRSNDLVAGVCWNPPCMYTRALERARKTAAYAQPPSLPSKKVPPALTTR